MKSLKSFLTSESFLFVFFSIIVIAAGTIAVPYRYFSAKPDTTYLGIEFYANDYSIYVSNILQGQKGRWTLLDKHTSEPHKGTIIHDEYLLWGKLMGLFGISQIPAFHLSRVVFGAIMLLVLYYFLGLIFPSKLRLLSFFIILFSAGFSFLVKTPDGNWAIRNHMEWLTELDVFHRFNVILHYLLGNIFFLLSLIFLLKSFNLKSLRNLSFLVLSGILMVLVHPVNLVIFYGLLVIYLLFSTTFRFISSKYQMSNIKFEIQKEFIPSILFFLTTIPTLLYYKSQFYVSPWNHMAAWEGVAQYFLPLTEYALTIGPTFFLAPFGLLALLRGNFKLRTLNNEKFDNLVPSVYPERNRGKVKELKIGLILLSWILSFFILIFYSYPFLAISQVRFMQNFIFIPFGILAVIGIVFIVDILSSMVTKIFNVSQLKQKLSRVLTTLIIIVIISISIPNFLRSIQIKLTIFNPNDSLVFPEKSWIEAMEWLGKNSKPEEVILSDWHAGHAIPYIAGNTVYIGHPWATLNRTEKDNKLYKFLRGQMSESEEKEFLRETNAVYLFFGYQERFYGLKPDNSPFFIKIFDNNSVKIYKFQP